AMSDHDTNETGFRLVGLMYEAPVFELRVEEGGAPPGPHRESLTGSEAVERRQHADHGLRRLEAAHIENDQVRIEPDAPVIGAVLFGPVGEAAPAEHTIERHRLEDRAKDEHPARTKLGDRGHDLGQRLFPPPEVLAHIEV